MMNLRQLAPPLAALAASWVGLVTFVIATAGRLPARVATHFDLHGVPNGWMDRSTHAWAMIGVGVGVPLFLLFIFAIIRLCHGGGLNIPHRDYWMEPARREATLDFLLCAMLWLACFIVAFDAGLHWLILRANERTPVALSNRGIWWLNGVFLTVIAGWIAALLARFLRRR